MSNMMITVVEVDMTPFEDFIRWPAIPESIPFNKIYFLKDDKIIGECRWGLRYKGQVTCYMSNDAAREFFKDFPEVKILGDNTPMRFWCHDGTPDPMFPDLDPERFNGITIVDGYMFDYGFFGTKRYEHIEGYAKELNKYRERTDAV